MPERQVWQVAIGLGLPDREGPGSVGGERIHPVALLLEASLDKLTDGARIPRFTSFGPVSDFAEAATRLLGDDYDSGSAPFECTLTVYATEDEIDELVPVIHHDLEVDSAQFSRAANRVVTIGLRPLFDYVNQADSYQYLVDQWSEAPRNGR